MANNSSVHSVPALKPDVEYALGLSSIGYVYVQPFICLVGFALNVVNSCIFARKTFAAPAYLLMFALSISDSITLGLRIPQGMIYYRGNSMTQKMIAIYAYIYATYVEVPITNMSENMSAWLTVSLAIERFVAMKHWNLSKQYCHRQNAKRLVLAITAISVILNLPYFMIHQLQVQKRSNGAVRILSSTTRFGDSSFYTVFSWLRIFLVQIIPLFFLCHSNILLLILVYEHNSRFRSQSLKMQSRMNQPVIKSESFESSRDGDTQVANETMLLSGSRTTLQAESTLPEEQQKHVPLTSGQPADAAGPHDGHHKWGHASQHGTKGVASQNNYQQQKKKAAQQKLTILLIAVILLFLFGEIPQALSYQRIFQVFGFCTAGAFHHCPTYIVYRMITTNLALTAYGLKFFLYIFLNKLFQKELRSCC
ncbi:unnamed protein product [Dibothriocephalus latus]|uniref:G-protein coupled receptors family 1 profile domain-containing protein n=1 Tax=Dibothriocephalus latus TaxID=60516 RepID=A0A3P6TEG8_DIBLA|nr:unnamed protein product [Dibothriocephalus latus]